MNLVSIANRYLPGITIGPRVFEKKPRNLNEAVERLHDFGKFSNVVDDPTGQSGQLIAKTFRRAATRREVLLLAAKRQEIVERFDRDLVGNEVVAEIARTDLLPLDGISRAALLLRFGSEPVDGRDRCRKVARDES